MAEYIEKERLISVIESNIKNAHEFDENDERFWRKVLFEVIDIPPSDVRENVPGWWEPFTLRTDPPITNYKCSVCGRRLIGYSNPRDVPFCHCGADMRETTQCND